MRPYLAPIQRATVPGIPAPIQRATVPGIPATIGPPVASPFSSPIAPPCPAHAAQAAPPPAAIQYLAPGWPAPPPQPSAVAVAATVANPKPKKRSPGLIGAVVALTLGLLAALGATAYFWFAADSWHQVSAAWEEQAVAQGAINTEVTERLDAALEDLAATRSELGYATDRITELADDRAQLGDQQVMTQAQFDAQISAQQHNIQVALSIATALANCIDGKEQIITALENPGRYTPESVAIVTGQVEQICQTALAANEQMQRELG